MPRPAFFMFRLRCIVVAWLSGGGVLNAQEPPHSYVVVGTYTEGRPDEGLYVYRLDEATGALQAVAHGEALTNPSYVTVAPNARTLYACTESKMPGKGSVSAFAFDPLSGVVRPLNTQPSGGENPVYVAVDPSGRWVVAASYTQAGLALYPVQANGSLGPATQQFTFTTGSLTLVDRQDGAHLHAAVFGPDARYLYVPDLGADRIRVFRFDAEAAQPLGVADSLDVRTAPGSGPRHLVFHPSGRFAYCTEELKGTLAAYAVEEGRLTLLERVPGYAKPPAIGSSADLHVSPDGRFLYASHRGDGGNSLSIHRIDAATGRLTLVGHQATGGEHPRSFALDPTGRYLVVANLGSNELVVFQRDPATGLLKKHGKTVHVPRPACVCFVRNGP